MPQCQHTTVKGSRCSRQVEGRFCWQHQRQVKKQPEEVTQPTITKEEEEFLKQDIIKPFEVIAHGRRQEVYLSEYYDESPVRKTKPSIHSNYLLNKTIPIYVHLPKIGQPVTFQGLTTVEQFMGTIQNSYVDKGIDVRELDTHLGDLIVYKGLRKIPNKKFHYELLTDYPEDF